MTSKDYIDKLISRYRLPPTQCYDMVGQTVITQTPVLRVKLHSDYAWGVPLCKYVDGLAGLAHALVATDGVVGNRRGWHSGRTPITLMYVFGVDG